VIARILRTLLTLWAVITLTFVIATVLPADPARIAAGAQARPADVVAIRTEMGLNGSFASRYRLFLTHIVHIAYESSEHESAPPTAKLLERRSPHASCWKLFALHFDLGRSYQQRRGVLDVLAERLPRTLFLAVIAVLFQLLLGIALGCYAAQKPGFASRTLMGLTLVTVSFPTFALGVLLQYVFAHRLGWLPMDGFGAGPTEHIASVILPALTLGIFGAAYYARLTEEELRRELRADYARTARAKGASQLRTLLVHALRNTLLPLGTSATLDLGALIGGAIVTETIFRWPGVGQLAIAALLDRDMPVLMGTVLTAAIAVVIANSLADGLYGFLDPRVGKR
jgi:peptide/nickel transport system permease protein